MKNSHVVERYSPVICLFRFYSLLVAHDIFLHLYKPTDQIATSNAAQQLLINYNGNKFPTALLEFLLGY